MSVHCPFQNGEIAERERPWYEPASELLPSRLVVVTALTGIINKTIDY